MMSRTEGEVAMTQSLFYTTESHTDRERDVDIAEMTIEEELCEGENGAQLSHLCRKRTNTRC